MRSVGNYGETNGPKARPEISDARTTWLTRSTSERAHATQCAQILTVLLGLSMIAVMAAGRQAQAQTETVLHSFAPARDGMLPAGLISDGNGNFYGAASNGGHGYGTIFELSPDGSGAWNETTIHRFTGGEDGAYPNGLAIDSAGNLYGTARYGGVYQSGVAFELSPLAAKWKETVLHSFGGTGNDGYFPRTGLIMDSAGNLYGTFSYGIFQLKPSGSRWREQVIYQNYAYSNADYAGLTMDAAGNIFVVTTSTVIELSPTGTGE